MFLNLLEECVPKCTRKSVRKLRAASAKRKIERKIADDDNDANEDEYSCVFRVSTYCAYTYMSALDRHMEMRFQFAKEYRGAGSIEWLDSIASRAIPRSGERNIF